LLGIPFEILIPSVHEDVAAGGDPRDTALLLARMKAEAAAVMKQRNIIVAADTLVVQRGKAMGKPADAAAASAMLAALRGQEHRVMTGLAVLVPESQLVTVQTVETHVWMREYRDKEMAEYIARGEPFDKAGGYAIQDRAFRPVDRIAGCYANVVGLPLCHLFIRLQEVGFAMTVSPAKACEIYTRQQCLVAAEVLENDDR
jgi:MAF protein